MAASINVSRQALRPLIPVALIAFLILPISLWAILQPTRTGSEAQILPASSPITSIPDSCQPDINKAIYLTPPDQPGCHDLQTAINAVPNYLSGYAIFITPGTYIIPNNSPYSVQIKDKVQLRIVGRKLSNDTRPKLLFPNNSGGLLIENSSLTLVSLEFEGITANGLLDANNSHDIAFNDLKVNALASHAIDINNSPNFTLQSSSITSEANCVTFANSHGASIGGNLFQHCANALTAYQSSASIYNNVIINNSEAAIALYSPGSVYIGYNTMVNNAFHASYYAIRSTTHLTNISNLNIQNNILVGNTGGFYFDSASQLTYNFQNNDVFTIGQRFAGIPDQTGQNGNISADPLFNPYQYCLQPGSPALLPTSHMGRTGSCYNQPGDFNYSRSINALDYRFLTDRYAVKNNPPSTPDLDKDYDFDFLDLKHFTDIYSAQNP